jgi:hypothetical protein
VLWTQLHHSPRSGLQKVKDSQEMIEMIEIEYNQALISGQWETEEEERDGEGIRTGQIMIDNGDGKVCQVQGTGDNGDRSKKHARNPQKQARGDNDARNPQKQARGDNDGKEIVQDRKKGAHMREARGEATVPVQDRKIGEGSVQDLGHAQNPEDSQSSERRVEANVRGRNLLEQQ